MLNNHDMENYKSFYNRKRCKRNKTGWERESERWRSSLTVWTMCSRIKNQFSEELPVHGVKSWSLQTYPVVTFAAQWEERKTESHLSWTWVPPRLRTPEWWWGTVWKVLCGFVTHLYDRPLQSLAQFGVALQLLLLVSWWHFLHSCAVAEVLEYGMFISSACRSTYGGYHFTIFLIPVSILCPYISIYEHDKICN